MKNFKKPKLIGLTMAAFLAIGANSAFAHEHNYSVKPGDTLYKISIKNDISVNHIKMWNGLSNETIYPGQNLSLSAPHSHKINYKVKSGDTLFLISKAYNVSVAQIKLTNHLTSDMLHVGQILGIPAKDIQENSKSTSAVPAFLKDGVFPLAKGTYTPYTDTWGESREYGGDRAHEGTDILAAKGTPLYSATDGKIANYGWSQLGGWRLTIKTSEGYSLYYAHMSKYAAGLSKGAYVKKGQLIGYVGDSGYGPEGTTGKFVSHLHFGIYDSSWNAVNGYNNLKYWELNK